MEERREKEAIAIGEIQVGEQHEFWTLISFAQWKIYKQPFQISR
jgi:hypothetical protein